MKTKKLNLAERIRFAKSKIRSAEKDLEVDLVLGVDLMKFGINSGLVEWDLYRIEQWSRYLKNTCEMHDLEYKLVY